MSLENLPTTVPELAGQLRKFGLTFYQSSALAAVLKHKRISATKVSRATDVPITKVYGVLGELALRGYITEELGRPKYYTSPNPEIVMGLIVKSHEERLDTLRKFSQRALQMIAR